LDCGDFGRENSDRQQWKNVDDEEVLQGDALFGRLSFSTTTNIPSALVNLRVQNVTGSRSTGQFVPNGGGVDGRIIVVNREPVLVAERANPRQLQVFAPPGLTYQIDYSSQVDGPWIPLRTVTHGTSISSRITWEMIQGSVFYRLAPPR